MFSNNFILFLSIFLSLGTLKCCYANKKGDDGVLHDDPHRDPSLCEVCKYLASELHERLDETGKTREVIETGYGLDQKKKRKEYRKSELRLIEAVNDPHVCEKILQYNIHAERKGSLRFAKGRSQTMETLHNLVDKGVNVDLGIPYDLWDTPSAGVTEMQRKCFKIVEDYEEDIEDWYWNNQEKDLSNFLCREKVLRKDDQECLSEEWTGKETTFNDEDNKDDKEEPKKEEKQKEKSVRKDKDKLKEDEEAKKRAEEGKDEL